MSVQELKKAKATFAHAHQYKLLLACGIADGILSGQSVTPEELDEYRLARLNEARCGDALNRLIEQALADESSRRAAEKVADEIEEWLRSIDRGGHRG